MALNRAVAVAFAEGLDAAIPLLEALAESLADYHLWHATRADLLRRLGRAEEARAAYAKAAELSQNDVERRFIERRPEELGAVPRDRPLAPVLVEDRAEDDDEGGQTDQI